MTLQLTVLGCSGTYAGADNACSGYLVQDEGVKVLVEAGPGTVSNLQRHIDLPALDAVVLSHAHPDHWLDLPVLRNAWKYVLDLEGLPVYGTASILSLAVQFTTAHDLYPTIVWRTITDEDEIAIGGMRFRFSRTNHPIETLAMRVDADGSSLVYSADTGSGWSMGSLGDGIDLAVCEATFAAGEEERAHEVHLTTTQAGEMGREAGVGRLVLTHMIPTGRRDEYREQGSEAFGAPVSLAEPHERYEM